MFTRILLIVMFGLCMVDAPCHAALLSLYTFDRTYDNAAAGAARCIPEGFAGRYHAPQFSVSDGPIAGGQAMKFDGTDDTLDLTTEAFPRASAYGEPSQGFWTGSIAFWVKTPDRTREQVVLGGARLGDNTTFEIKVNQGKLQLHIEAAESTKDAGMFLAQQAPDTADCANDQWHHVVLTWNVTTGAVGTGSAQLYIDGTPQAVVLLRNDIASNNTFSPWNWPVRLGGLGRDVLYEIYCFSGVLDDVAVWNEALSEPKALAIYRLAKDEALGLGVRDVQDLFDIFDDDPSSRGVVQGRLWRRAEHLSGEPGHVAGDHDAVVLDNQGNGVRAMPEPVNNARPNTMERSLTTGDL